ncbi:uncharacterized protein METZ01_LOCUS313542 [marine metagenome]|uniref:Uncharacterized protein n=1 Tax=marine metagenome TaxID=408172 RepID=A0A382NJM0_9ZZZZ
MSVDSATLNQNAPNNDAKHLRSKEKLNAFFTARSTGAKTAEGKARIVEALILSTAEKPVRNALKPVTSSLSYTNWKG